jgi:hypothetical protein
LGSISSSFTRGKVINTVYHKAGGKLSLALDASGASVTATNFCDGRQHLSFSVTTLVAPLIMT